MTTLYVTVPELAQATRAYYIRSTETGAEGVVVVGEPAQLRFCEECNHVVSSLYAVARCEHCGATNGGAR